MEYNLQNLPTPLPFPASKRAFDLLFTTLIFLLALPVFSLILILFSLETMLVPKNRGSLLYFEKRISAGKIIKFYKFRIFKTEAINSHFKKYGFVQTKALESNRNNLTLLGYLLKQTYMDELPQLWCVLKGDMTLVGPRPSNVQVSMEDLRFGRLQRWIFRCGLTGDFQIIKHQKNGPTQAEIDTGYAKFCQTAGWKKIWAHDLLILLKSLVTVIQAKGY